MQLTVLQRPFAWSDVYDIYNEAGEPVYEVRSDYLSLGLHIHVFDKRTGKEVGAVLEKMTLARPKFRILLDGQELGFVQRQMNAFRPRHRVEYQGWQVEGDIPGRSYRVTEQDREVFSVCKAHCPLGEASAMKYQDPAVEIPGLLLVLAIDASNCRHKT